MVDQISPTCLHRSIHESRPRSRSSPSRSRSAEGPPQTRSRSRRGVVGCRPWCGHGIHSWWWGILLLVLICTERGLCAASPFPGESVPSRPSPHSYSSSSSSSSRRQGEEDGEEDPLARLSKVFGIKRIPGKVFHRTPPQYMTELYHEVADTGGLTKASGPYNANTIRSFPDRDTVRQQHFHYNVTRLQPQDSEEERMLEAEFHIFKMKPRPTRSAQAPPPHHLQLKVYQVLDKNKMDSPEGLRLLDAQRVSTHKHGWITFKVAKAVESWRLRPEENHGLLVVAKALKGQTYSGSYLRFAQRNHHHDSKQPILVVFSDDATAAKQPTFVSPEDQDYKDILAELNEDQQIQAAAAAAATERKQTQQQKDPPRTRPEAELTTSAPSGFQRNMVFQQAVFMLNEHARAQSAQPTSRPAERRGRSKRQASTSSKRKRQSGRRKRTYNVGSYRYRRTCAKHKMYVDFDEIGWSGWIISPKGYDAYHCSGECPFPLGQSQKPTNHATVQSIVHALRVGNKNLGTPCCVPNKLFSISLLYFDDDENVILKQYDDMVAASCGCH
ncbi:bone morphogenetic protein 2-like isoform X2 [Babylonia areolata]